MGCDIRMVLERKNDDGKYVGLHNFGSRRVVGYAEAKKICDDARVPFPLWGSWEVRDRNYVLFGALAGVRCDGPEAKGIPDDASDLAQMLIDQDGSDGHSHSYLNLDEALPIFGAHLRGKQMLDKNRHQICDDLFDVEYDKRHKYRLVFWFDN